MLIGHKNHNRLQKTRPQTEIRRPKSGAARVPHASKDQGHDQTPKDLFGPKKIDNFEKPFFPLNLSKS